MFYRFRSPWQFAWRRASIISMHLCCRVCDEDVPLPIRGKSRKTGAHRYAAHRQGAAKNECATRTELEPLEAGLCLVALFFVLILGR